MRDGGTLGEWLSHVEQSAGASSDCHSNTANHHRVGPEHGDRAGALRKQRNINDYEGDPISEQAVAECIKQAEQLYRAVTAWLAANRPDLE
jgi:hypothetical protein